jgi:hypothetical protein
LSWNPLRDHDERAESQAAVSVGPADPMPAEEEAIASVSFVRFHA